MLPLLHRQVWSHFISGSFRLFASASITNRTSSYRILFQCRPSVKYGLICVALPCKVFLMDLTVHMDNEINPGPNFSVECFAKFSPSINTTLRVADSAVQHTMYSKDQLLGLRCKYSISDSLFYLLKDLQILNTRGLRAGVKSRSKLHQIPIIVNRRNMAASRVNSTRANLHNLGKIFCKQKPTAWSLPSVLLCNARSVFPKIDELRASALTS